MRRLVPLLLLCITLLAPTARAHAPVFLSDGTPAALPVRSPVTDPEKSWAIYGRLPCGATANVIPVTARAGQQLYLQSLVPTVPGLDLTWVRVHLWLWT